MRYLTVLSLVSLVFLSNQQLLGQGNNTVIVPATVYRDYLIVVQGSIGDLEKRNLIVDTGAYPSVVTPDVAKKLHLSGSTEELGAVSHNIHSRVVFLPSLGFGPIHAENLRVIVQDLAEFDRKLGIRVDGLVGLDAIFPNSFRIDYRAKKMILGPVEALPFAVPIRWRKSTACIDVNVNGQPASLLLDTGAADIMLFASRLSHVAKEPGVNFASTNLGGNFTLRQIKLTGLEAGGSDLGPREVFLSDARNMDAYPYDGLLGAGSFRFRQIAFDFEHHLFSWEPIRSKGTTLLAAHDPGKGQPTLPLGSPEPREEAPRSLSLCSMNASLAVCDMPPAMGVLDSHR